MADDDADLDEKIEQTQRELEDTEIINLVHDLTNSSSVTYITNADVEFLMPQQIQNIDFSVRWLKINNFITKTFMFICTTPKL